MFASLVVVAVFCHLGIISAQYGYSPDQSPFPNAEANLETINRVLGTLERRRELHRTKIEELSTSANANLGLRNRFLNNVKVQLDFTGHQNAKRLDDLLNGLTESGITFIDTLREEIRALDAQLSKHVDTLQNQVMSYQQKFIKVIADVQQDVLQDQSRIDVTQGEADSIAVRLDNLYLDTGDYLVKLYTLERNLVSVISSVNSQRTANGGARLTTDQPTTTAYFDPEFDGVPQVALVHIIGFNVTREAQQPQPYSYPQRNSGPSQFYYGIEDVLWNDRDQVTYLDMSAGGWATHAVPFDADFIYLDETEFSKTDLPDV